MKHHIKLLLGLSLLILILVVAGCGGGGGEDPTPIEKGPSSDYLGLQVGAVLKYDLSGQEDTGTFHSNLTYYYKVIDLFSIKQTVKS